MPTARQRREPLIFENARYLLARPATVQTLHANPTVALTIDTITFPPTCC
jgi:hypothetical protein